MQKFWQYVAIVSLIACDTGDELIPIEPSIEFQEVSLVEANMNLGHAGYIDLNFLLQDGDSDFGLDHYIHRDPPYHYVSYFRKTDLALVTDKELEQGRYHPSELLDYSDRSRTGLDSLPPFVKPYNCTRWKMFMNFNDPNAVRDTVFFKLNKRALNVFVDVYELDPFLGWAKVDFTQISEYPFCENEYTLYGRMLPPDEITSVEGDDYYVTFSASAVGKNKWRIKYKIRVLWALRAIFRNRPLKLTLQVADRAGHLSNIVETTPIQF